MFLESFGKHIRTFFFFRPKIRRSISTSFWRFYIETLWSNFTFKFRRTVRSELRSTRNPLIIVTLRLDGPDLKIKFELIQVIELAQDQQNSSHVTPHLSATCRSLSQIRSSWKLKPHIITRQSLILRRERERQRNLFPHFSSIISFSETLVLFSGRRFSLSLEPPHQIRLRYFSIFGQPFFGIFVRAFLENLLRHLYHFFSRRRLYKRWSIDINHLSLQFGASPKFLLFLQFISNRVSIF